ncbi:MAG: tetratricopeptide repeat protein [Candidatus Omnitrophica bacterium]|nr:tetratricopeptide repeat protein [Candidatus Omnitrophota bacterium]
MKQKQLFVILVLLAAVFLAYGNSLKGQFIWDDKPLIAENPLLKDPNLWGKAFTVELYEGSRANYYRPLLTITFILNSLFLGSVPAGYHLVNILLHFLVGYLLCLLLEKITGSLSVSLVASLVFLIHPIHAQAVTYISGRADPLAAIFLLLSVFFYINAEMGRGKYGISLLCFMCALLAKETSVMLPVVLLGLDLLQGAQKKIKIKKELPFFLIAGLYCVLRLGQLNFSQGNPFLAKKGFALLQIGFFERFILFLKTLAIYIGSFFVPVHLHMERIISDEKIYHSYWAGIIFCCLLMGFVIRGMLKCDIRIRRAALFFLFWFFVWLLPQSAFVFPKIMAEHFLYLPSMSLCFMLAFWINIIERSLIKKLLLGTVLFYFAFLTWQQNKGWLDEMCFFKRTVYYAPTSIRARDSLAALYLQEGRYSDAELEYMKILDSRDKFAGQQGAQVVEAAALYNLGILYEKTGRPIEALAAYNSAVAINPKMEKAYNNVGLVYQQQGEVKRAEEFFKKAIELDGLFYQAMNNLAQLYAQENRLDEAIRLWNAALIVYPGYETAKKNIIIANKLINKD